MIIAIIVGIVLLAWLCYGPIPTIVYKYLKNNRCSEEKEILLTFDDGPDAVYTQQLLNVLEEADIEAIFFLLGQKVQKYPSVAKKIVQQQHRVGLHGSAHENMWFLTPKKTKESIEKGMAQLRDNNMHPNFYRPPYGNINLFTLKYARKQGLKALWWTAIVGDWKKTESTELVERLNHRLTPGMVVVLHDSAEDTGGQQGSAQMMIKALEQWIPLVRQQGYRFIKPSERESE